MSDPTPTWNSPFEFDMLLMEPIHEMMQTGIRVDREKQAELLDSYQTQWDATQAKINTIAGGELNVGSYKQMQEVLYDDLGMPVRRNKGKPTTNEDALRSIMAIAEEKVRTLKTESAKFRWKRGFLICRLALDIRSYRKRISSYLDIEYDTDGRIRSTISIGGTETGRFSHSKTLWDTGINLATVPRELRSMFIADEGCYLVELDLNRGESWIYAHLSEDPELLRIHLDGLDFHSETAAAISEAFGERLSADWISAHKHDEAYRIRYLGKKVNHASAYQMGPFRGAEVVNQESDDTGITITTGQFRTAQELWKNKYFMMESWWNSIERELNEARTLTTPYGRSRQFHDRWGSSLFKEATAYVPQSTSVDYLNRGLLRSFHRFQKKGAWGLKLLGQSHDSILVQINEDDIHEAIPELTSTLAEERLTINDKEFGIPIEGEYGRNWGDLEEY